MVDRSPESLGGGIAGLGRQRASGLGVDTRVAELRFVYVVLIIREEGVAGEQRVNEVRGGRVVLVPGEEPGLYPVAGVAEHAPVGAHVRYYSQRCAVSEPVENRHEVAGRAR